MSDILCVTWTILPQEPPQPLLHCRRCGGTRRYRTSGKFRVNANGKRVDAWLIYKCTACDNTWNRPILERRPVASIEPLLLAALFANEAALAERLAFDAGALKRWAPQLDEAAGAVVTKAVLAGNTARVRALQIVCVVPSPLTLRLDRLLAEALRLPRARIKALAASSALTLSPPAPQFLRRPVRDGMRLLLELPAGDAEWIAASASEEFL